MSRVCTVCRSPEILAINKALVAGESIRDISGRYGLARSSVDRHASNHLPEVLVKGKQAQDEAHALDVVKQLKAINGVALKILHEAQEQKDSDTALKAMDRVLRQITLQARLLGELQEDGANISIHLHPEWRRTREVILVALRPFPQARVAVAEALAALGDGQ